MFETPRINRFVYRDGLPKELGDIRRRGYEVVDPDLLFESYSMGKTRHRPLFSCGFFNCIAMGVVMQDSEGLASRSLIHVTPGGLAYPSGNYISFENCLRTFTQSESSIARWGFLAGGIRPLDGRFENVYLKTLGVARSIMSGIGIENPMIVEPFQNGPTDIFWGNEIYVVGN